MLGSSSEDIRLDGEFELCEAARCRSPGGCLLRQ